METLFNYHQALQREAMNDYDQAGTLLKSGIVAQVVHMIDPKADGVHIDVSNRVGEVAIQLASTTRRSVIALVRNPMSAFNALALCIGSGVTARHHIESEYEQRADGSIGMRKILNVHQALRLNPHAPGVVNILCETIETQQGLQFLLAQDTTISSLSWTFPRYMGRSYGYECNPNEDLMTQITARVQRDREQILRLATILMPPGGQLIIAGDANVQDDASLDRPVDIRETQGFQHDKLEHWKSSWEPARGLLVRSLENQTIPLFGQSPHMPFNGVSVLEFRRKSGMDLDAIEHSNQLLGIGED